jgi:hypothetical protein
VQSARFSAREAEVLTPVSRSASLLKGDPHIRRYLRFAWDGAAILAPSVSSDLGRYTPPEPRRGGILFLECDLPPTRMPAKELTRSPSPDAVPGKARTTKKSPTPCAAPPSPVTMANPHGLSPM